MPRMVVAAAREVLGADRVGTCLAVMTQLLAAAAGLGVVAGAKLTLDALTRPEHADVGLTVALLLLAGCTGITNAVSSLQSQQLRMLGERVSQRTWERLLDRTARADLITYESTGFATTLNRIRNNAVTSPMMVTVSLVGVISGGAGVLTLASALVSIEPMLVPILLSAGIPTVLLSRWASRTEFAFVRRTTVGLRRRDYYRDVLTLRPYAAEIRTFGSTRPLRAHHDRANAGYTADMRGHLRRRQLIAGLIALGVAAALTAALLAIVALLRGGRIDLAEAGAAAVAVRLLGGQLSTLFTCVGGLIQSAPFVADLDRFVGSGPPAAPVGRTLALTDRLRLSGVSFRYPEQRRDAVTDVDLEIRAGEIVALVGENGSGKTTLSKIVAGLYEPDVGSRRWDGEQPTAADLRASVSVIFQDFVRYQMTVRDNIAISDDTRDDEAVREAARRAGVLGMLRDAPDGLDTMVGRDLDEGQDLSGGQWQRVALARALHRDTPLVVLDEPSSALDPRAEQELFADVRGMLDGRSALLISHRFSSTRLADRIYVLADGRIIESGTHDELLARAGHYAELYRLQSAAYR